MVCREVVISNEHGLHTRPGNGFVQLAKQYSCSITVTKNGKQADAKSLLRLMKADISKGDRISVSCDGGDEEKAMDALISYLDSIRE